MDWMERFDDGDYEPPRLGIDFVKPWVIFVEADE